MGIGKKGYFGMKSELSDFHELANRLSKLGQIGSAVEESKNTERWANEYKHVLKVIFAKFA